MRDKVVRKAHALRGELYRGLVLDAAEEEFAAHGYADARMQRLADKVRLSVGTIYNLFDSKEALYAAIHARGAGELTPRLMAALAAGGPALTRIARAVHVHLSFCAAHPQQLRMLLWQATFWSSHEAHAPGIELESIERGVRAVTAFCSEAIERGELVAGEPRRMVLSMIAGASGPLARLARARDARAARSSRGADRAAAHADVRRWVSGSSCRPLLESTAVSRALAADTASAHPPYRKSPGAREKSHQGFVRVPSLIERTALGAEMGDL